MSPYEPPGYRITRTPAAFIRSDVSLVPSWLSHTASLMPSAVEGTVARPARALTVTVTGVVSACALGRSTASNATPAARAAAAVAARAILRGLMRQSNRQAIDLNAPMLFAPVAGCQAAVARCAAGAGPASPSRSRPAAADRNFRLPRVGGRHLARS